jgi:hypothetical protein
MQTFDNIKIKVPVFITYDCKKIKNHQDATTKEFLEDFQKEFFNRSVSIERKSLDLKSNFELNYNYTVIALLPPCLFTHTKIYY